MLLKHFGFEIIGLKIADETSLSFSLDYMSILPYQKFKRRILKENGFCWEEWSYFTLKFFIKELFIYLREREAEREGEKH